MKCRFQGSVPSQACLLFLGCSVGWLRATIHWFKWEQKAKFHPLCGSGSLLSCSSGHFRAAGTCCCNLHLWLNMSISVHVLILPFFFCTTFSLEVLNVYLYFLELMTVISFFFIILRCWKPGWLMSLAFVFKVCQCCQAKICCYSHNGKITSKHSFVPVLLVSWQAKQRGRAFSALHVRSNQGKLF